jgi:hypothetical protein
MNRRNEEKSSPRKKCLVRNDVVDPEDEAATQRQELQRQHAGQKAWLRKVRSIPEGKVIDVTNLDIYGRGSVTVPTPSESNKVYHRHTDVKLISKSPEGWNRAVDWLGLDIKWIV